MKRIFSLAILMFSISVNSINAQEVERTDAPKYTTFSPAQFQGKYKQEAILIDCRDFVSFNKSHLKGALHISATDINFAAKMMRLEKDKNIFIYGSTLSESREVAETIANMGFLYIYNLNGGFDDLVKLGMQLEK